MTALTKPTSGREQEQLEVGDGLDAFFGHGYAAAD